MRRGHSPPVCRDAKERGKRTGSEILMAPFTVHDLEKRVRDRAQAEPGASYTRTLLDKGLAHCAKKLGEEAVEVAIAAIAEDRSRVVAETADLLYHLLVVLHARGIPLAEVEVELGGRTQQTGLDEKAARKGG
jgi:phosphoribosyl-ATP pyrophosphohydrolase